MYEPRMVMVLLKRSEPHEPIQTQMVGTYPTIAPIEVARFALKVKLSPFRISGRRWIIGGEEDNLTPLL
jgi:hypothetical protein